MVDYQSVGRTLSCIARNLHQHRHQNQGHKAVHESKNQRRYGQTQEAYDDERIPFQRDNGHFLVTDKTYRWLNHRRYG